MSYGVNYQTMFLREVGAECLTEMPAPPAASRMFGEFIYQGDFAVMCGPEGAGKSILGLQIANALSRGRDINGFDTDCDSQKVVYLDFENKRNEFIRRYSLEGKKPYPFHPNFSKVTFHSKFYDYTRMRKDLMRELNMKVRDGSTVLVVNNLDALRCFVAEGFILGMLKQIQVQKKLTVLLIATSRGKPGQKAGVNQLGRLVRGMADSIFVVGLSKQGEDIRYIKQLKCSEGRPVYHEKRVAEFVINKQGSFTGFRHTGFGKEYPHVAEPPSGIDAEIIQLRLSSPALTFAEIATQLSTYKMKVKRVLDKYGELLGENPDTEILNPKAGNAGSLATLVTPVTVKNSNIEILNSKLEDAESVGGVVTNEVCTLTPDCQEGGTAHNLPSPGGEGRLSSIQPTDCTGVRKAENLATLVTPVTVKNPNTEIRNSKVEDAESVGGVVTNEVCALTPDCQDGGTAHNLPSPGGEGRLSSIQPTDCTGVRKAENLATLVTPVTVKNPNTEILNSKVEDAGSIGTVVTNEVCALTPDCQEGGTAHNFPSPRGEGRLSSIQPTDCTGVRELKPLRE